MGKGTEAQLSLFIVESDILYCAVSHILLETSQCGLFLHTYCPKPSLELKNEKKGDR